MDSAFLFEKQLGMVSKRAFCQLHLICQFSHSLNSGDLAMFL